MAQKTAIIIGGGPAGLTAAYELLNTSDIRPIIFEMSDQVGGISKTINYKGNRIDIGGHRFFSKSQRINRWWLNILPLQGAPSSDDKKLNRPVPLSQEAGAPNPETSDRVMLVRQRLSRIFAFRKFFSYPISLSLETLLNLGFFRLVRIMTSYIKSRLFPLKKERTLQDFLINRFGEELYLTFFKSYTEKVWGVPCEEISADWGAQRIKGLSVIKTITHALRKVFVRRQASMAQEGTETSLIEQFMYPKLGPGQLWEEVARMIQEKKAEIHLHSQVVGMKHQDGRVSDVQIKDMRTGQIKSVPGDYFISTMPIKDLVKGLEPQPPMDVASVAGQLMYRDFITVGILLKKLKIKNKTKQKTVNDIVPDNWIYVQEEDVFLGRIQIFNNWSPYLVKDAKTAWLGLEYFCNEGDQLWNRKDSELVSLATEELIKIGFIEEAGDVVDAVVLRVPKTYPSYCGIYDQFDVVRCYLDLFENLFLIGRNGMHRYNNTDHSMMTAMVAVENIIKGQKNKDNIWAVNMEKVYHE